MAYGDNTDIVQEFRGVTFGASTKVTATEVDTMVNEASLEIDSYLATRYDVPVDSGTSPNAYAFCKMLAKMIVSFRVRGILFETEKRGEGEKKYVTTSADEARRILKAIRDSKQNLPADAVLSGNTTSGAFAIETDASNDFDYGVDQW